MTATEIARRYYRLGLSAAKQRYLSAAVAYAAYASALDPEMDDAVRLEEICRQELGADINETLEPEFERIRVLAEQKKWKAAALAAREVSDRSVRLLAVQGCLWALAKRYVPAMDCFAQVLAKDRGNRLAAEALAELGRQRKYFWRFF
jgi:hypothetical protein